MVAEESNVPQLRNVYEQWHNMVVAGNLDGLIALYAEDAVLESNLILVLEKDPSGTIQGKKALRPHFAAFMKYMQQNPFNSSNDWFRFDNFLTDGKRRIIWEYPSTNTQGEPQLDVVESYDVENGLIVKHRVYWGVNGHKVLAKFDGKLE